MRGKKVNVGLVCTRGKKVNMGLVCIRVKKCKVGLFCTRVKTCKRRLISLRVKKVNVDLISTVVKNINICSVCRRVKKVNMSTVNKWPLLRVVYTSIRECNQLTSFCIVSVHEYYAGTVIRSIFSRRPLPIYTRIHAHDHNRETLGIFKYDCSKIEKRPFVKNSTNQKNMLFLSLTLSQLQLNT